MRILIACDKFKGSLTSQQVAEAIKQGLLAINPAWQPQTQPVADGGQGFLKAVAAFRPLEFFDVPCRDPLDRPITAMIAWEANTQTAWIESAEAIGIHLLHPEQLNPLRTTTHGLADLMLAALDLKPSQIVIGVGGSATCDGGICFLQGLGFELRDAQNHPLPGKALNMARVHRLLPSSHSYPPIAALVDVLNPPVGEQGGIAVYGPQKGATPEELDILEYGMGQFLRCLSLQTKQDYIQLPGGGAAGGLGLALHACLHAKLVSGSDWLLQASGLAECLPEYDLLITGEGRFDGQSHSGKLPGRLLHLAQEHAVKAILVTGQPTPSEQLPEGVQAFDVSSMAEDSATNPEATYQALVKIGKQIGAALIG